MSLSRVLRGSEADAMSRWELPSVDRRREAPEASAPARAAAEEEAPPQPPTADELEAIRAQARDEGHREGRQAGYEEGLAAGRRAGESEQNELINHQKKRLETLEKLIEAQEEPLEQMDDAVQEQMARLVLTLARQVIRRELRTQPGEILPVIREAIALLPMGARGVRVYVHPEDHRFLNELLGDDEGERAWRLLDDPTLSRGGCRVEAERSRVDATLERRLAQLASQLLGGREEDLAGDMAPADADGEAAEDLSEAAPPDSTADEPSEAPRDE